MVRRKIVHGKEAYLLVDLLHDVKVMSGDMGCAEPIINNTRELKRRLVEEFGDDISFFPTGRNCLVHCSYMNPCEYSIATTKGRGLRDADIISSFGALVHRKVQERIDKAGE